MWVLLGPGDTALVPSPSYPIHIYAPLFAGADVRQVPTGRPPRRQDDVRVSAFFANLMEAWESTWPKPRVVMSCRSRTTRPPSASTSRSWTRLVEFAKEHDIVLVHDFAYADLGFDGYDPPSILQVPGPRTWPSSCTR